MGQVLDDMLFQDMVISSIIERLRKWDEADKGTPPFVYALTSSLVTGIYTSEGEECLLRKLIVDAVARFGKTLDFEHFGEDRGHPVEFIREIMVALGRLKDKRAADDELRRQRAVLNQPPSSVQPGSPRGILRKSSGSIAGSRHKSVSFDGVKIVFAEDECVYHLHTKAGVGCWRKGVQSD
jgi:hypothetical protein